MWNLYVFSLLVFYAPSNKFVSAAAEGMTENMFEKKVNLITYKNYVINWKLELLVRQTGVSV